MSKRFGDVVAAEDVHVQVSAGEIHGLLGRNGAGKTTVLRMITGLLVPDKGSVKVCSFDLWSQPAKAKRLLGYVPDTPTLYERLSGHEFLRFIGGLYGMSSEAVDLSAAPLLDLLEVDKWMDRPVHTYSAGTRRKLSIVAGLLHQPKVIVLDEVTNTLDAVAIAQVKQLLMTLRNQGTAILITTHLLSIASDLCDTITIIHDGKVLNTLRRDDWLNNNESLETQFLRLTVGDSCTS
ncbi:MAG: ABC transporter ATP-binding protein [Betaproteobacteria bacterium]